MSADTTTEPDCGTESKTGTHSILKVSYPNTATFIIAYSILRCTEVAALSPNLKTELRREGSADRRQLATTRGVPYRKSATRTNTDTKSVFGIAAKTLLITVPASVEKRSSTICVARPARYPTTSAVFAHAGDQRDTVSRNVCNRTLPNSKAATTTAKARTLAKQGQDGQPQQSVLHGTHAIGVF